MADLLRILAVLLGGASFGVGAVVAREWVRRLDGFGRLAAQIFAVVHLLVVLFIAGVLAERAGEPVYWQTPMALTIFTAKLSCLELIRQLQRDQYLRYDPPQRRVTDKPAP